MNNSIFKAISVFAMLFLTVLSLTSCEEEGASLIISSDTYVVEAGETLDIEQLRQMFLTDTEALPNTTEPPEVTALDDTSTEYMDNVTDEAVYTVYWVKNGEVWHTISTCSSLSRSKNILSGTVEEAMLAGKDRVCKRCGS